MTTSRDRLVALARSYVGCGAADPERYLDLVGPGESAAMRRDMLAMSGCALVVAGLWRLAGLDVPELAPPYRIGSAVSRLVAVAKRLGAWRAYAPGALPGLGDCVLVRSGGPRPVEHVYTVTSAPVLSAGSLRFSSIDGGQPPGRQQITARVRDWRNGTDAARDDTSAGAFGAGRRIVGWVDVGALGLRTLEEEVYE